MSHPLVSVAVISYQSAKYVLETLESIKAQTYNSIELIISDDNSSDNTVDVCRNWMSENAKRFVNTELITTDINTGPSGNYNRAESACTGDWVLTIDGDDVLLPDAIANYLDYIEWNPKAKFIFAKAKVFGDSEDRCKYFEEEVFDPGFFNLSPSQQLDELLTGRNHICSGTFFYNRTARLKTGVINDERIPMLEDWPKWVNLIQSRISLDFMDKYSLLYRLSPCSISTSKNNTMQRLYCAQFFVYYQFKYQWKKDHKLFLIEKYCFAKNTIHSNSIFWKTVVRAIMFCRKTLGKAPAPSCAESFSNIPD